MSSFFAAAPPPKLPHHCTTDAPPKSTPPLPRRCQRSAPLLLACRVPLFPTTAAPHQALPVTQHCRRTTTSRHCHPTDIGGGFCYRKVAASASGASCARTSLTRSSVTSRSPPPVLRCATAAPPLHRRSLSDCSLTGLRHTLCPCCCLPSSQPASAYCHVTRPPATATPATRHPRTGRQRGGLVHPPSGAGMRHLEVLVHPPSGASMRLCPCMGSIRRMMVMFLLVLVDCFFSCTPPVPPPLPPH